MKKIYFTLLLLLLVFQLSKAQYMETFESFTGSGTAKPTSFTSNSQSFTLTTTSCTTGGTFGIFIPSQSWLNCSGSTVSNGSGAYGVGTSCTAGNCSGTSSKFIENGAATGTSQIYSVKTTNAALFTVQSVQLYVSTNEGGTPAASGAIFRGKKAGSTIFTVTLSSGLNTSFGTNNGFTYIDFSTAGGSNNTAYTIDELEVQGTGSVNYIALDNFTWTAAATLSAVNSQTNIACYGGTGAASVSVSGGSSPYSYSWAPSGGTGATATGLAAGSYTCTITDASSSVLTKVFTITQPSSALSATSSFTNTGCFGGSNGRASVSASGGTPSYTYAWAPSGGTGATATGLAAGNYTCTITDANSCIYTKVVAVGQPTVLTATTSSTSVSCFGGSNGTAHVTPSGGTSPYTYSWAPSGGTGATASGLSAGSYTCTITDNNSCTATKVVVVSQPSSGITATTSSTSVSCFGGSNGTAGVTASGGTSPYTYSWAPSGGTGATASGLSAGSYTCTITDNNSCTATKVVVVSQPSSGITATTSSTSVSCFGGSNGTAGVTASGGTSPYTYSWAPSGGTGATASALSAGSYTCTITDNNNCMISKLLNITQPSAALSANAISTSISCNGGSATVTVTGTGGTSPYAGTGSFTDVAGSYTYTVTDDNGCLASTNITITEPSVLTASVSATSISCNGGSATVTVTGNGGISPYTGVGSFTDVAGSYTYTVTDDNGCLASTNITITEPSVLTASVSATSISCNGGSATVTVTDNGGTAPYISPGSITEAAGSYTYTVTDNNGCTASTSITISQPAAIATSQSFTVCAGGNVTVGTHTYATTGTYTDVLTSLGGCDSTITTNLTVQNSIDIGTTVTGGTVSSNQAGATYQWIDCTNGDAPIAGATNQSYSGTGTFAVTITLNGCVATSTCVSIVSTDIPNVNAISNIINIYPNPNSGTFTLTSTSESVYQIINELGQTIKTLPLNSGNNYEVNVNGLPGGIYFIIGSSAGIPVKKKIIVTQ